MRKEINEQVFSMHKKLVSGTILRDLIEQDSGRLALPPSCIIAIHKFKILY
jgi:hypothetical protein